MKLKDEFKLTGELEIILRGPDGAIKDYRKIPNLIVTAGKNWWAARGTNAPPAAMSHMAVGTSAVAPDPANVTLGAEVGRAALINQSTVGNVTTYSAAFIAGVGTGALTEAGIFNDPDANEGTMLNRATFGVVTKTAGDSMQINWTVTQN